ncbi:MAG: radical SAM protein [Firmicutes bacterium]|nr:radical SAM protein [Bacillota bacterium]
MKKHAIIPVFIPHRGCPNDCVFCNQKAITARQPDVRPSDVRNIIDTYLPTLSGRGLETIEVAFFGGSFTGLPIEEQSAFLEVAAEYKSKGLIDKIHMSTRPDYIDQKILDNLRHYSADTIELGVQSFDDSVLAAAGRGHTAADVYEACSLIHEYGFELGIQLMIGLPGDSLEKCLYSSRETVRMEPSIARLYPTIVLRDTALFDMYKAGLYHPLTTEEAVAITKEMYRILTDAHINIIRVGLKSTDLISGSGEESDQTWGHTYHPAFRQLVEGEIAREDIEAQILQLPAVGTESAAASADRNPGSGNGKSGGGKEKRRITVSGNGVSFSNMIGNGACNRKYFGARYPDLSIRFAVDDSLPDMTFTVKES